MESYNQKIRNIAILMGYINMAIQIDSYQDVKGEYLDILNTINFWTKHNQNFNNIKKQDIYNIYNKIDLIREKKLFDKNIGDEKNLSDEILIWYEIVFYNGNKGE